MKRKTAIRKARKKAIGDKQKRTRDIRSGIRLDYEDGLEDLQERNGNIDPSAAVAKHNLIRKGE